MKSKMSFLILNVIILDNKAGSGEIPVKILKICGCIFDTLKYCSNQSIETCNFPDFLKKVNITPVLKNDDPLDKLNKDLLVLYPYSLRSTRNYFIVNYMNLPKIY